MRITRGEIDLLDVPQEDPLLLSRGRRFTTIPHVLVRIYTDTGIMGVGLAYRLGMQDGAYVAAAASAMADALMGMDPLRPELVRRLFTEGQNPSDEPHAMAASSIDIALWDIAGQAAELPLWQLLGGARDRAQAYASGNLWRIVGPDGLRDAVERHKARGFRAVKVRIGEAITPEMEAARIAVVRETLGEEGTLLVDVNQGWDATQAVEVARHLEPYNLGWLEDPVGPRNMEGMAFVAVALETPVCAGEHYFTKTDHLRLLERRAVDVLMADVLRVGGITEWRKIAGMAEAFGVPITAHLSPEVSVHLVAAAPNGHMVECMPASAPLLKTDLTLEDGKVLAPRAPGLGIQLDDAAIRRYQSR